MTMGYWFGPKQPLHRQFALGMGLISHLDELSDRDLQVGHQRVYDLAGLKIWLMRSLSWLRKLVFSSSFAELMMIEFNPN